ncbi:S1 RNA-binding domain-containing protein [Glycomyces terrestris]|uniref:S1 RNA-binding domain-containing protein n=1 Tax=Glycomyces terrestris TaxID=2493553 RepID=A0A426V354_9ACTN|nr:S1 RNA-binding domain-containing protein [Glycomyces terrestris]RRS01339.1 S1 RNA-binding domain-containing protein [Glycomyces terrestris]
MAASEHSLNHLRSGQICTGRVVAIASFGVTFVDVGGVTAMINIPELSWRRVRHPSEVVAVGREVTALILDVDERRQRVTLSLKALQPDPMAALVTRVGEVVTGPVTRAAPIGVFVRVEDRPDGFEGLVPGAAFEVGDVLSVVLVEVDPARRRILLALPPG